MGRFARRRILVVEDEAAIAIDLARLLADQGAVVVGPAAFVQQALDCLAEGPIDCAVLDIKLGDEDSSPIAAILKKAGVPMVFVSGYTDHAMTKEFTAPLVNKPYNRNDLVNTVEAALKRVFG